MALELDQQGPAHAAAARLRHDVHPLQLPTRVVEARDAAAGDRTVAVADDEEHALGRPEHRFLANRPDVGLAVERAELGLLRGAQRADVRRVEGLRPRTHRRPRRGGRR
jgi:hypothetical protein